MPSSRSACGANRITKHPIYFGYQIYFLTHTKQLAKFEVYIFSKTDILYNV